MAILRFTRCQGRRSRSCTGSSRLTCRTCFPLFPPSRSARSQKARLGSTAEPNRLNTSDDEGEQELLTKGDNNPSDDLVLYNGMKHLKKSHIVGKVSGYVPYVGYATILMVSPFFVSLFLLGKIRQVVRADDLPPSRLE